jgi:hypothetical protein
LGKVRCIEPTFILSPYLVSSFSQGYPNHFFYHGVLLPPSDRQSSQSQCGPLPILPEW